MTDDLYPEGMWVFESFKGSSVRAGKAYYPAHLTVRMERGDAMEFLESLARQYRAGRDVIEMDWSGTIERLEDDHA